MGDIYFDGGGDWNNEEINVATSGTTTTFYANTGIDTDTAHYFALGSGIMRRIVIRADKACVISSINGKSPKSPITILANTTFRITGGLKIKSIAIDTQSVTTQLKVFVTG